MKALTVLRLRCCNVRCALLRTCRPKVGCRFYSLEWNRGCRRCKSALTSAINEASVVPSGMKARTDIRRSSKGHAIELLNAAFHDTLEGTITELDERFGRPGRAPKHQKICHCDTEGRERRDPEHRGCESAVALRLAIGGNSWSAWYL